MTEHPTDRILASMRRLLERDGPKSLSFRQVSRESGLSVGTVSYYFGSREGMLEAALDGWHEATAAVVAAMVSGNPADSKQTAATLVTKLTRMAFANRPTVRLRTMAWMLNWKLPRVRREEVQHSLALVSKLPWGPQWKPDERRGLALAMAFSVQRFACMEDEELVALTGTATIEDAHDLIERVIQRLLQDVSRS